MQRSEINRHIDVAGAFFQQHRFYLPAWAKWSPEQWATQGKEIDEIRHNGLGWDVTDFASGQFEATGLTLFTIRNGKPSRDSKPYCEKIMRVGVDQVTPTHFHWKKMEDIICRAGGTLCMRLWQANEEEEITQDSVTVQIDGVTTRITPGNIVRLRPGQSITFLPYIYHTFWAEGEPCLVGEVSTVNDDTNDNRFLQPLDRFPDIDEDEAARFCLCNEYPPCR